MSCGAERYKMSTSDNAASLLHGWRVVYPQNSYLKQSSAVTAQCAAEWGAAAGMSPKTHK